MSREDYAEIVHDPPRFRDELDGLIERYPELFPPEIKQGDQLFGLTRQSVKLPDVQVRRICLTSPDEQGRRAVYPVVPSFVMPDRTGYTDEVEKALFLRRFGVPYWALTYVFGHHDMYWERQVAQLGRVDLVGTTVKDPQKVPEHLLADETHTRLNGEKASIATTVGEGGVLGAALALAADEEQLTEA